MIALVTSCINPFKDNDTSFKSYLNKDERLDQTIYTISQLELFGFKEIYLLDNSQTFDFSILTNKVSCNLKIRHVQQYQFKNKGINELLLLLSVLNELPDDEEIFKISGRYYPNENFICQLDKGFAFKFKHYNFHSKRRNVSTRAYFVINKKVYEEFLLKCIAETFSYTKRVVGLQSAMNLVKQTFNPKTSAEVNTPIEVAAAMVLKNGEYAVKLVDTIGVEGQIAGVENYELIKE